MNAAAATIDWTPIIVAMVGGVFSTIGVIALAIINKNVKDKQAAEVLGNAVRNSLGAIQQAIEVGVKGADLKTTANPELAAGVNYVLTHAGEEADRLGINSAAIAEKINAQIGLTKIAATTTTTVTAPTPVEVVTTTEKPS